MGIYFKTTRIHKNELDGVLKYRVFKSTLPPNLNL